MSMLGASVIATSEDISVEGKGKSLSCLKVYYSVRKGSGVRNGVNLH